MFLNRYSFPNSYGKLSEIFFRKKPLNQNDLLCLHVWGKVNEPSDGKLVIIRLLKSPPLTGGGLIGIAVPWKSTRHWNLATSGHLLLVDAMYFLRSCCETSHRSILQLDFSSLWELHNQDTHF